MKYTYLLIDLFTVLVPFIFSFHPRIRFHKQWNRFLPGMFITAILFIAWDVYFTHIGVWNFNEKYVSGIYLLNLPIEELLFFFSVPYACVFTYYCLTNFYHLDWSKASERYACIALSSFLLITAILHIEKVYTSFTFISTSLICILLQFYYKIRWLGKAITVYFVLLIPFMIVNGLLTGTGLNEAVVRYNDEENIEIRLLTIPIEDIIYGFELYLFNLFFYLHIPFDKLQLQRVQV